MAKPHQGRISEICKAFEALAKLFFSFPPCCRGLVFEAFASMHPNRFSSRSPLYRKVSKALARQPKAFKATPGLARPLRDLPEAFSRPMSLVSRPLEAAPRPSFYVFPLTVEAFRGPPEASPRPISLATRGHSRPPEAAPRPPFLRVSPYSGSIPRPTGTRIYIILI